MQDTTAPSCRLTFGGNRPRHGLLRSRIYSEVIVRSGDVVVLNLSRHILLLDKCRNGNRLALFSGSLAGESYSKCAGTISVNLGDVVDEKSSFVFSLWQSHSSNNGNEPLENGFNGE